MFPTIDHVEEYLRNKQWDKLLKEYQKYKDTIKDSTESNIVIDMVYFHFHYFILLDSWSYDGVYPQGHWRASFHALQF